MQVGAVGSSYQQRSLPWDAQRSVNLFPISDPQGKTPSALYGTPGLQLLGTAGSGPGRGAFAAAAGRSFIVSGSFLYEVFGDGSSISRGSLDGSMGSVTMDENGVQLAICDGASLYIFTYATNTFVKVVSANLPSASTVTFIDGYFVVNRVNSGIFQISKLYDGTVWAALDFATAESSPDNLLRVLNVGGQLWLFGVKTTEIWYNSGAVAFPFARVNSAAKLDTGIGAPYSAVAALDNSVTWVGRDNNGFGIVYRAEGFTPQRLSTEPIELRIQSAPSPETLRAYSYQEEGHTFYVLTGGGMETTLVFDLATQQWHERAFLNDAGNYELHLGAMSIYAFNKQLVIDRRNGNIYTQSLNVYSDNGEEIARDRIFTHMFDENQRFIVNDLTIGFETGVGLQTGLGQTPRATLYTSRDGGKTYSGGRTKSLGRVGNYIRRVCWHRLGQARQMTFKIRVTDPVKVVITGGWINTNG